MNIQTQNLSVTIKKRKSMYSMNLLLLEENVQANFHKIARQHNVLVECRNSSGEKS